MAETVIFSNKGCAYKIALNKASQFWEIKPKISSKAPVLFKGSDIQDSDAFARALAFNDLRVIAPTTKNFSTLSLEGIALLGYNAQDSFIKEFREWFENNRARSGNTIQVSAKNEAFTVLLENIRIGSINPEFHILDFGIRGYIIEDD